MDDRLKINLTQMERPHDTAGGFFDRNAVVTSGGFLDSLGSADINQSMLSMDVRSTARQNVTESNFATSRFFSRKRVEPGSLLPPNSLSVRRKVDKLKKDL